MIRPPILRRGDTIGIVAPASPSFNPEDLRKGKKTLENLGFKVALGKTLLKKNGYLAGRDEERAEDLNRMFRDQAVRGIICVRGGYGSGRLLEFLDYEAIKKNPKIFMGYSDITALQLAIYKKTRMITFYGPMVVTEMADLFPDYTRRQMLQALTSTEPIGKIGGVPGGRPVEVLGKGVAVGRLTGGYLPAVAASMGTPYEIETRGKILFFEDQRKEPFEIDRMLTQLILGRKFRGVTGIGVGECVDCGPKGRFPCSFSLEEILQDRLGGLGIPVLSGLCFGHGGKKATLPLGVKALLNTQERFLEILEPAVRG